MDSGSQAGSLEKAQDAAAKEICPFFCSLVQPLTVSAWDNDLQVRIHSQEIVFKSAHRSTAWSSVSAHLASAQVTKNGPGINHQDTGTPTLPCEMKRVRRNEEALPITGGDMKT